MEDFSLHCVLRRVAKYRHISATAKRGCPAPVTSAADIRPAKKGILVNGVCQNYRTAAAAAVVCLRGMFASFAGEHGAAMPDRGRNLSGVLCSFRYLKFLMRSVASAFVARNAQPSLPSSSLATKTKFYDFSRASTFFRRIVQRGRSR